MKAHKVSLKELAEGLDEPYRPLEVLKVNDHVVRMALFRGHYHFHVHRGEDELFFVLKGRMKIKFEGGEEIEAGEGEMVLVPRGVVHAPSSEEGALVLMFEPEGLRSRGD